MKEQSYLTFSLNSCLYGVSTVYLEEIFALPELTSITQASDYIVGVVNLRGYTLPVMDLNLFLGYQSSDYLLTDSIVVLRWQEVRVGIIVNKVHELRDMSPEKITTAFFNEQELTGLEKNTIFADMVRTVEDVFILTNLEKLFHSVKLQQVTLAQYSLEQTIQDRDKTDNSKINDSEFLLTQQPVLYQNPTLEEREIFQQRAKNLKLSVESEDLKNLIPLAVVALNDHLFGIDLKMVREFTDLRTVIPIPCCPTHIIGNVNLRGEILTIVDIRRLLNLPMTGIASGFKAMVVEVEGLVAGVIVEEVSDVMFFLNPLDITTATTAIHSINGKYLQGVAPYQEKRMSILDLPQIFLSGGLIVDEAI